MPEVSVHFDNHARTATDRNRIKFEQTTIGLFPDVGATFFLSRLDGRLGIYLGLTSERVTGIGAFLSGIATHYVPSERLAALEARLAELPSNATHAIVNAAIEEFSADLDDLKTDVYTLVGSKRRAIDAIFSKSTAEEIIAELKSLEEGTYDFEGLKVQGQVLDEENLKKWAKATRETILGRSPTSVKVSLMAIQEGSTLDIDEAFSMDMRIATACCVS